MATSTLSEALCRWASAAAAEQLQLGVGAYLVREGRGGPRALGRVEAFTVELRPRALGPAPMIRLVGGARIEAVALVRVMVRINGRLQWAGAPQFIGERALAEEWRPAPAELVAAKLAEIDAAEQERRVQFFWPQSDLAAELSPNKGR